MRKLSILLLLFAIIGSFAPQTISAFQTCSELPFSQQSDQILFGRPVLRVAIAPATNELVIRNIYELLNNGETKFADWVGYKVNPQSFGEEREAAFATDGCLNEDRTLEATPNDENDFQLAMSAGYVPVPLAPNATFTNSPHWSATQLYSNVVPMHTALVDAWHQLEKDVRDYASQGNEVYVLTGPVYRNEVPRLPRADEDHVAPSGFWKIVYEFAPADDQNENPFIHYYAVLLDQTGCLSDIESERVSCETVNQDYSRSPIRIVDIEGFTRWDFFVDMENVQEFRVERAFGTLDLGSEE